MGRASLCMILASAVATTLSCAGHRAPRATTELARSTPEAAVDDSPPVGRLDDRAVPRAYRLELELDPGRETFRGRVAIDVELSRPTGTVWLNARSLTIERALLTGPDSQRIEATITSDPSSEHREGQADLVGVVAARRVDVGRATVELEFSGPFGAEGGLVRAGETDHIIFSDLEATDARAAFPCFDDPRFKAPFDVSLIVPAGLVAVSNYPEAGAEPVGGDRRRVRFETTRPLATYLVAVAVGGFEIIDGPDAPVPIRILAPPGVADHSAHALEVVPRALALLEQMLDEPMPYPKLDILAVPEWNSRTAGMENPGLIVLSRALVLVDESQPPSWLESARAESTHTLVHELSHLWFGDLVTLGGWGDLWLNEGFATWLGHELTPRLEPGWSPTINSQFSAVDLLAAEDDRPRRPVRRTIATPQDINELFSVPTYAGGAALLATLEAWLGEERFLSFLRRYVDRHRDGTVETRDVVEEVAAVAAEAGLSADVDAMIRGFLGSVRAPVVTVTPRCSDGAGTEIDVAVRNPDAGAAPWPVPVCVAFEGSAAPSCLVTADRGTIALPTRSCPSWVVPNPGGAGFYRYRLVDGWSAAAVERGRLSREDARALGAWVLEDLESYALEDQISVLAYLASRRSSMSLDRLVALERSLVEPSSRSEFVRRVAAGVAGQRVGFGPVPTPRDDTSAMASWLAQLGDQALRDEARAVLDASLAGGGGDNLLTAYPTFAAAAAGGDASLFARVRRAAFNPRTRARSAYLHALGSFQDAGSLHRLRRLLEDRRTSGDDARTILTGVAENPALRERTAELLCAQLRRLSPWQIEPVARTLCDPDDLEPIMQELRARGVTEDFEQRIREPVLRCVDQRTRGLDAARRLLGP
jgi:alanyl aminopeptidase